MTDAATATAQPSTTPAPQPSSAEPNLQADESEALFREYAERANRRLDDSEAALAPAPEPPDVDAGAVKPTESETAAQAAVSPSATGAAAPAAAAPAVVAKPAAPAEPNDDELLADLPDAVRERLKARLTAGQQQLADLQKANKELDHKFRSENARVKALSRQQPPAAPKVATPAPRPEAQAAWDKVKKQFPEIAQGVEALFEAKGGNPKNTDELLQYVALKKAEDELAAGFGAVAAVHPTFLEDSQKPEFKQWLDDQPAKVKTWADSQDPQDALLLYDRYYGAGGRARVEPPATPAPQPADPAAAEAAKAAGEVLARRQLQQDGARHPSTKGGGAPNTNLDLNDPDALYRYYAAKANKRLEGSP